MNKNQTKQKIEIDILIQCKNPTNKKKENITVHIAVHIKNKVKRINKQRKQIH